MAKIHVLTPEAAPSLRDEVVQALRGGQVVLLPTEAVYARVARVDDAAARDRLAAGPDDVVQRLVPDVAAAEAAGAVLTAPARRLARRYWPGPLALVLDTPEGPVAFRVPGHDLVREVAAAVAVVAASPGEPVDFAPALEAAGARVDLAVDAGRTALAAPATVVRAPAAGPLTVVREGFLDPGPLERTANRLIVFVCTGNTCRSPMAEGLFRAALARRLGLPDAAPERLAAAGWLVASAGIAAAEGLPAAENAVAVMAERGVDLRDHAAQQLAGPLAERADLLVTMSEGHRRSLVDWWPELASRAIVLDPRGVPDPIGSGIDTYRATADHIAGQLDPLVDALLEADAAGRSPASAVVPGGAPTGDGEPPGARLAGGPAGRPPAGQP
ncbi:MAG: Sua5/YciO/YrdC/YwlC family protein [Planctomycetes bacterium]|nr:Sua5/YciO/YrdC/YwlC family protein [Planctomycetota bacterium]